MAQEDKNAGRLVPIDRRRLEERLEKITRDHFHGRAFDRREMRYLSGLASNYLFLLADLYDQPTIERIMQDDPRPTLDWIRRLWERRKQRHEDQAAASLRRIRSVPDEVRLIGEKCLYDVGLFGKRLHGGYDLPELGVASYRRASEILAALSTDEQLCEFYRADRIGQEHIETEITFLRQCARYFFDYAEMLSHLHLFQGPEPLADLLPETAADEVATDGDEAEPEACEERIPEVRSVLGASEAAAPLQITEPEESTALEPIPAPEEDPEIARLTQQELLSHYERLLLFSALDIDELRRKLRSVVIDQPEAIDKVCDDFSLFATGTHSRRRPLSYFFIGPTGVGKNYLVEQLVATLEELWGREVPYLLIEGPGYTYPSDINELKGSTRGFIRSDEEGILTEFHHRASQAPFSVILIDEVEKAHAQLRKFFLSVMDRGTTTDNRGQALNFASTLLVYTSNLGYSRLQQATEPIGFSDQDARAEFQRRELGYDLKRELSPEFMNRVRIVHFDPLTEESIGQIFDLELAKIARRYQRFHGLELTVTRAGRKALIARGYSPEHGARHLARVLNEVCNIGVSKKLRRDCQERDETDEVSKLLGYIQEARTEELAPDLEMLSSRVVAFTRARVSYRKVAVDFARGRFVYRTSS
jgi:hypothetical protein